MVECLEHLNYRAESRRKVEFEAGLRKWKTLSTQQWMGTFFKLGKVKAVKGEGWTPPFISCARAPDK